MGRRLGQHFLKDPAILDRIVSSINPAPNDVVLEIGAGQGDLTRRLANGVGYVHAIELDLQLIQQLRRSDLKDNIKLVHGDALRLDWAEITGDRPFKVIGNVPYYITSPLIDRALRHPLPDVVVFLIQAEVARRLTAGAGTRTYGALTVGVGAVADVENLFRVKAGSFVVPPKVDSAVVRITPKSAPLVSEADRKGFRNFINALFSRRRKQIRGILRTGVSAPTVEVDLVLDELDIDPTSRPEVLAIETLVDLFQKLGRVD